MLIRRFTAPAVQMRGLATNWESPRQNDTVGRYAIITHKSSAPRDSHLNPGSMQVLQNEQQN